MSQSTFLKKFAISAICATGLLSSAAFAVPVGTACAIVVAGNGNDAVGAADTDDATLNTHWADKCAFSQVNPDGGGNAGDTSGFASSFPSATWDLLGKISQNGGSVTNGNLVLTFNTNGNWSIKNTSTRGLMLDLVLDIHAGSGSTAFLFDNQTLAGGQTLTGTWLIDWVNNGGKNPGFSNVAFFDSNLGPSGSGGSTGGQVPEPASLALIGLGLLGVASLRKRNKA